MDGCEQISQEWSSLSGLYTAEEDDFMSQMLGNFNLEIPSALWPAHESTVMTVTGISNSSYFPVNGDNCNTNYFQFSQGSSYMSMSFDAKLSPYSVQGNNSMNEITDNELGIEVIGDKNLQAHKECEILVSESTEEDINSNVEKPGKRSRSSIEVGKNKRNVKSMKKAKSGSVSNSGEDKSPGFQGQNLSSSCSEEDEANVSEELNGGGSSSLSPEDSTTLKGKSKSTRGSATDPQSVYARRRRERINERLRILQNLVPNGTKVDISTMLEEAVQYVKFLQLQIKLLSSDDLWMYAPIAYNGMNIGLDLNISPTKQP